MTKKAKDVFIHQKSGELVQATRSEARHLPDDYKKVVFSVDPKSGKPKARVRMDGVTIDISERPADAAPVQVPGGPPALAEVKPHGDANTN